MMDLRESFQMDEEFLRVGRLSLTKSRHSHAVHIANNMRKADARECYIHNLTPLEALTESLEIHDAKTYTIKFDHTPIGMCGNVPIDNNMARIWLLGTDDINKNFRPFLRGCIPTINLIQGTYSSVENFVPVDHADTVMWLTWCGFVFDEDVYEINSHMFMRFERCLLDKNNVIDFKSRPVMH